MNKAYLVLLGILFLAGCTGLTGEFIKEDCPACDSCCPEDITPYPSCDSCCPSDTPYASCNSCCDTTELEGWISNLTNQLTLKDNQIINLEEQISELNEIINPTPQEPVEDLTPEDIIDTTAPTITYFKINGVYLNQGDTFTINAGQTLNVEFDASDNLAGVEYCNFDWSFGGEFSRTSIGLHNQPYTYNIEINEYVVRDTYELRVWCRDNAGNSNTLEKSVYYVEVK